MEISTTQIKLFSILRVLMTSQKRNEIIIIFYKSQFVLSANSLKPNLNNEQLDLMKGYKNLPQVCRYYIIRLNKTFLTALMLQTALIVRCFYVYINEVNYTAKVQMVSPYLLRRHYQYHILKHIKTLEALITLLIPFNCFLLIGLSICSKTTQMLTSLKISPVFKNVI